MTSAETERAVVIVGGGPTGMMLAAELALAGVDAVVLERRPGRELDRPGALGLHSRTIEIFDQRGIAERFLREGATHPAVRFADAVIDLGDCPTRHPYVLALGQEHIERIMAEWARELGVRIHYGHEVVGLRPDDTGVASPRRSPAWTRFVRPVSRTVADRRIRRTREDAGLLGRRTFDTRGHAGAIVRDEMRRHTGRAACAGSGSMAGNATAAAA